MPRTAGWAWWCAGLAVLVACHPLESVDDYPFPDADLSSDGADTSVEPGDTDATEAGAQDSSGADAADLADEPDGVDLDGDSGGVDVEADVQTDVETDAVVASVVVTPRGGIRAVGAAVPLSAEAVGLTAATWAWSAEPAVDFEPVDAASTTATMPLVPTDALRITATACDAAGTCASGQAHFQVRLGVWVWDQTTASSPDGSRERPYPTIQQGIDDAAEQAATGAPVPVVVYVAAGTYAEDIQLADGVEVEGGYDPSNWDAPPGGARATLEGTATFDLADTGEATLRRFAIHPPEVGGASCRLLVAGGTAHVGAVRVEQGAVGGKTPCVSGLPYTAAVLLTGGKGDFVDVVADLTDPNAQGPTVAVAAVDGQLRFQSGSIDVAAPVAEAPPQAGVRCGQCDLTLLRTAVRVHGGAPGVGVLLDAPVAALLDGVSINVPLVGDQATCKDATDCIGVQVVGGTGATVVLAPAPQAGSEYTCCDPSVFPVIVRNSAILGGQANFAAGVVLGSDTESAPPTCLDGNRIFAGVSTNADPALASVGVRDHGGGLWMFNNLVHGGVSAASVGASLRDAVASNNVIHGGGPLLAPSGGERSVGVHVDGAQVRLRNNILIAGRGSDAVAILDLGQRAELAANNFAAVNGQIAARVCEGAGSCDLTTASQVDQSYLIAPGRGSLQASCGALDLGQRTWTPLAYASNPCVDAGIDLNAGCEAICGTPLNSFNGPYRALMTSVGSDGTCTSSNDPTSDGKPDIGPHELTP